MTQSRIIRRKEVQLKTGLACSSIYALMNNKEFPLPVKITKRSVGWIEREIDEWIELKAKSKRFLRRFR